MLDALGRGFTNQDAVVAAHVVGNGLVEAIAADANGRRIDDAVQRDDRHFGCAATNIEHHGATSFVNGHARADRRSHRLVNKVDLARARAFGRFANCASLNLRGPVRERRSERAGWAGNSEIRALFG